MADALTEPELALRQLRSQSVTRLARDAIERMILNGTLKAGSHLSESTLAARLGVSRGPVREACRALVENGLVISEANRGFFVRQLTLDEIGDVYDVRVALARLAGHTLALRITDEQITRLSQLVDEMEAAAHAEDENRFYDLNLAFHTAIVDFAANRKLSAISTGLVKELHVFRRRGLMATENMEASNREHRAILATLAARDAERAGEAMEAHLLAGKSRFLEAAGDDVRAAAEAPRQRGTRTRRA